jgi:NADH-quinone oxidoreductase subunit M
MPNFAAIYMIATLSSLGLPLLNGFIGEFTILSGVYQVSLRFAAWAVLGIILGAAYLLWLYQRVMFGPVTNVENEHLADLNAREYATLIPLVILAFWIGIYPKPLFTVLEGPVRQIVQQVNPGYYNAERNAAAAPTAMAKENAQVKPSAVAESGLHKTTRSVGGRLTHANNAANVTNGGSDRARTGSAIVTQSALSIPIDVPAAAAGQKR